MDEMKIKLNSIFMKGLLVKLIKKSIYKKYRQNVDIQLDKFDFELVGGKIKIKINSEITMNDVLFGMLLSKAVEGR